MNDESYGGFTLAIIRAGGKIYAGPIYHKNQVWNILFKFDKTHFIVSIDPERGSILLSETEYSHNAPDHIYALCCMGDRCKAQWVFYSHRDFFNRMPSILAGYSHEH